MLTKYLLLVLLPLSFCRATTYEYTSTNLPLTRLQNRRVQFWEETRTASIVVSNRNDIIFFGNHDSPLDYSCGDMCQILLDHLSDTMISKYLITHFRVKIYLYSVPPAATGPLKLCTAPSDYFWNRPYLSYKTPICTNWGRSFHPMGWLERGGYLMHPRDVDTLWVEIKIWYMTRDNYREMRENKTTEIFVPFFHDRTFNLPLKTHFYYGVSRSLARDSFRCQVRNELGNVVQLLNFRTKHYSTVYIHTTNILAGVSNSGVYTSTCWVLFFDEFASVTYNKTASVSFKLTFVQTPKLIIKGFWNDMILLSSQNSFNVSVYSVSPIALFEVEQSDGISFEGQPNVTEIELRNPFSVKTVHRVVIPNATEGLAATFTLRVTGEDGLSDTRTVRVIKPRGVHVSVSYQEVTVIKGDRVNIDCTVIGDTVDTVSWRRSYGTPRSPQTRDVRGANGRVLQLILPEATLEHSGEYVCTASDLNNTKSVSIILTVWPSERSSVERSSASLRVHPSGQSVVVVVTAVCALITGGLLLALCVAAGIYYLYHIINPSELPDAGLDPPPPVTKQQSTEQLWETIRRTSIQMDQVMSPKHRLSSYLGVTETVTKPQTDAVLRDTDKAVSKELEANEPVTSNQPGTLQETVSKELEANEPVTSNQLGTLQETGKDDRKKSKRERTDKLVTEAVDEGSHRAKRQRRKERGARESKSKGESSQRNKERSRSSRPDKDRKPPKVDKERPLETTEERPPKTTEKRPPKVDKERPLKATEERPLKTTVERPPKADEERLEPLELPTANAETQNTESLDPPTSEKEHPEPSKKTSPKSYKETEMPKAETSIAGKEAKPDAPPPSETNKRHRKDPVTLI